MYAPRIGMMSLRAGFCGADFCFEPLSTCSRYNEMKVKIVSKLHNCPGISIEKIAEETKSDLNDIIFQIAISRLRQVGKIYRHIGNYWAAIGA